MNAMFPKVLFEDQEIRRILFEKLAFEPGIDRPIRHTQTIRYADS